MGLANAFKSKQAGQISAVSMLVEAGLALYRGEKKIAALLLGAAALSYRWSIVGIVAEALIRIYQRVR
ncbi:hypothetical protein C448_01749 [Halococcus morrhuae DSM 1307]|uniref:Uncharacterized protein n=2 Tax=Halococcus TaxID=2249 RepID=M0MVY7_HALMO|nr:MULTISPECIES: hypothetical protein [Halococcus]EMA49771.1 hypothetical protein C448_01749 [Halococcus morrhuae DSM 1307]UOO96149.1 hypothetical protein MUK72_05420 [Halococcus dombrowskii]